MFDSLIQNIGIWIIGTLIGSLGEKSAGIMLLALCLLPVSCWAFLEILFFRMEEEDFI